ncbi:hypothetical protein Bpfe_014771 [Biomphalaria pfeifferi]|uniref:Uncharacterized protein n=1 Tax=Biomphalaria pfeifferi TaxID=112525 RepID=A0AAD8BJD9_BIOPF|nr:hypothetical protein Bpfe_014771 [Biomphalaria pfeifferi]
MIGQLKKRRTFQDIKNEWGFTFGFRLSTFRKYSELIPLVAIIGSALAGATFCICYFAATKLDVRFKSKPPRYLEVGPTECTKFYCIDPSIYRPIAELEAIKNDLKTETPKRPC